MVEEGREGGRWSCKMQWRRMALEANKLVDEQGQYWRYDQHAWRMES